MTTQLTFQDPVCGMNVAPEDSCSSEYEGNSYYFCCDDCRKKFESDPAGVLAARAQKNAEKNASDETAVHQISLSPRGESSCCHASHDGHEESSKEESPKRGKAR